jgi:PKD repeat protein
VTSPQSFSVEAWFRTTSTLGGKIVGFGSARTGLSAAYDRHVYLDTAGRVYFGVYSGGAREVHTTTAYNDGAWHHVVGTLSRAGLSLSVDGVLVGTRPEVTTANPFTGYWRVGGDKSWIAGRDWFAGSIDEVAVYATPLTAAQVSAHAAAGRTAPAPDAAPTAAFTAAASDLAVSVDGTSSTDPEGPIASYAWNFGDGSSGTGATASHTYAAAGTYPVTLTVTDAKGATGSATRTVTVTAPPPPADAPIAADAFAREVTGGFGAADVGGTWVVSGDPANVAVTGGSGRVAAGPATTAGARLGVSAQEVSLQADVVLEAAPTGGGSFVTLGTRNVGSTRYTAELWYTADGTVRLGLATVVDGVETELAAMPLADTYAPGSRLTVRFQVTGTSTAALAARAWPTGTTEPATWQVTAGDATAALARPGGVVVELYQSRSATAAQVLRVDDLRAVRPVAEAPAAP